MPDPLPAARYRIIRAGPIPLALTRDDASSLGTRWLMGTSAEKDLAGREDPGMEEEIANRLAAVLTGCPDTFMDVPLPRGGNFTRACWQACRLVPRGTTVTYARLATMAGGGRQAARAAGNAMRRNLLPVIVPCHRVVAADGPGGYDGSTRTDSARMGVKRWLQALET